MKKVIITGANGFVGSSLVNLLSQEDYFVYAVVKNEYSKIERIVLKENIKVIYCDMSDIESLSMNVNDKIDCFFHFAWTGTAGPLRSNETIQLLNVSNTLKAIHVADKMGCEKFVFAASIMEYECEKALELGIVPNCNNMYSYAKSAAKKMGLMLSKSLNIDFVPVVISNIFGEGESSPRLINTTIKKLLTLGNADFTSCEQMYDFIYVKDAVRAIKAISEKGKPYKDYYLGSKNPQPLKVYIESLRNVVAPNSTINYGVIPFTGVSLDYYKLFDLNAIENDTGFTPRFSFEEAIKNTTEWIKENENG